MKKKISILSLFIAFVLVILLYNSTYLRTNAEEKGRENKVYKVGVLTIVENRLIKAEGVYDKLNQYGLSHSNIDIIVKNASGKIHMLDELADELVDENVDIIITTGTHETVSAKKSTMEKEIPVVFIGVGCTVEIGLVNGNISTECNITGVDSHYVQLSGKRLEFLKRLVPSTKNVLVLYNPATTPFGPSSEYLYEAAEKLDIELDIVPVTSKEEVIQTLNEKSKTTDGVMLMCSFLFESMIDTINEIALEKQLPIIGVTDKQVEEGVLAFYGSTSYSEGAQAARIVANILKGQDPRIIPIESPEKLELHINIDTAKQLGIDIEAIKMPFVDRFVYTQGR